jgi:hypothetical protein
MNSNWLAATSFEYSMEIIAAINELSTYVKLKRVGIDDGSIKDVSVDKSRKILHTFLVHLQQVVKSTNGDETQPILGTDPRSGELVRKYMIQAKRNAASEGLYNISIEQLVGLISSNDPNRFDELIICLKDLRELVEQHMQRDVNNLLGDI